MIRLSRLHRLTLTGGAKASASLILKSKNKLPSEIHDKQLVSNQTEGRLFLVGFFKDEDVRSFMYAFSQCFLRCSIYFALSLPLTHSLCIESRVADVAFAEMLYLFQLLPTFPTSTQHRLSNAEAIPL